MSEQRIDFYAVFLGDVLQDTYTLARHAIDHAKALGNNARWIRLVEIREGESIVADGPNECAFVLLDCVRKERDAAIERAEKAEKAWRYLVKTIDDANTNERARYERETAARLLAAEYGAPDDEISFENAIEVESYWQRRAMWAKRTASVLAAACFGAKEAKG